MATFKFSSREAARHLFSLCQKEFEDAKERIAKEASERMLNEARIIAAKFSMSLSEMYEEMSATENVKIEIKETTK
jgi:hypothetical protein